MEITNNGYIKIRNNETLEFVEIDLFYSDALECIDRIIKALDTNFCAFGVNDTNCKIIDEIEFSNAYTIISADSHFLANLYGEDYCITNLKNNLNIMRDCYKLSAYPFKYTEIGEKMRQNILVYSLIYRQTEWCLTVHFDENDEMYIIDNE